MPGVELRPLQGSEFETVLELVRRSERRDGIPRRVGPADFDAWFTDLSLDDETRGAFVGHPEEIRRVKDEAFADHWGSTPSSPEMWRLVTDGHGIRRDLSSVAFADDRVVAFCPCARYPEADDVTGRRDGWGWHLGLSPAGGPDQPPVGR